MRKRILEIGCGHGFNTYCLSFRNEVTGVDISSENIEIARKRFPRLDFRVMDAGRLDFPDACFDEVQAIDVLEHVPDLDAVLAEVKRVLKPGGAFVANIPFHKSERWLQGLRPTYFNEMNHVRVFGECELEEMLGRLRLVMTRKSRRDFLNHVFQYYMLTRKSSKGTQLGIGNWKDTFASRSLFAFLMLFDTRLFRTPLAYIPVWVVTLPCGLAINWIGNCFLPKSLLYTFRNTG